MSLTSLTELLSTSGTQYRILDMGRRISKLSKDQFDKFEQGLIPYPAPYLHQAWLALFIWNPKHSEQNVVWFLKFPLDEQGFLVQAVRDDFLGRLMQNIQQMLDNQTLDEQHDALKDNPFSFTPDQEKMAMFHALASKMTHQPPSSFFDGAKAYFSGDLGWEHWQGVGYQGIADLVARMEEGNHTAYVLNALQRLPNEPLTALSTCLEHTKPDHTLFRALLDRVNKELNNSLPNTALLAAMLRGLSQGHDQASLRTLLLDVLKSPCANSAEVMVAIATRCHETLNFPDVLHHFLEALAISEAGQSGFSRILADLMFIPTLRVLILRDLRNPDRSEALSKAIGEMFGQSF
jgi:hypothetical protein